MKLFELNKKENTCTQQDGIELCKIIYDKLSPLGFYPALTGGLLYKEGERKDIDIVIFRNRQQHDNFETTDLYLELKAIGVTIDNFYGFVTKAKWKEYTVDLFNPETKESDVYTSKEECETTIVPIVPTVPLRVHQKHFKQL